MRSRRAFPLSLSHSPSLSLSLSLALFLFSLSRCISSTNCHPRGNANATYADRPLPIAPTRSFPYRRAVLFHALFPGAAPLAEKRMMARRVRFA